MREQAEINKTAWEHAAYDFWVSNHGCPAEKAAAIKADPLARFHFHRQYFNDIRGKRIANPCGSNGRLAVPLAFLGADVTVFDISEPNRRYALELAQEAGVKLEYVLGDFCETDTAKYGEAFDIVFAEGGVIHYFSDIDALTRTLYAITKPGGQLILNDFHPFWKINQSGTPMMSVKQTDGDYFDSRLHSVNVAYQGFFPQEDSGALPPVPVPVLHNGRNRNLGCIRGLQACRAAGAPLLRRQQAAVDVYNSRPARAITGG